ncbi:hypothetical protein HYR54_16010 [Candidatus Acetothermia bacterium]|nr:hypothetical protein [Candidatus Acetothermia bacterium]MBI3460777.1 hypothetical protein [Candidatus Acetothermia bacterium]
MYTLIRSLAETGSSEVPWDFARYYCDPTYAKEVEQRHKFRDKRTLAQQLKQLCRKQGWMQEDLAKHKTARH